MIVPTVITDNSQRFIIELGQYDVLAAPLDESLFRQGAEDTKQRNLLDIKCVLNLVDSRFADGAQVAVDEFCSGGVQFSRQRAIVFGLRFGGNGLLPACSVSHL